MMNRYTLSADSEELLEEAMLLIKAIKHNLVTHDRGARAALSGGKAAESGTLRQNALPRSISVQPAYHEMYFRGGTLPYEMVSSRGRVENPFCLPNSWHRPGFSFLEKCSDSLSFWPLPAKKALRSSLLARYQVTHPLFQLNATQP
jgi:hypothetical protein